jgi:glycosyltransferase involved in cell wall biosynthesis
MGTDKFVRLCLYSTRFAPSVGGIETTTALLAQWFAQHGGTVTVVTETANPGPEPNRPYTVLRQPGPAGLKEIFAAHDLVHVNGMSVRAVLAAWCARVPVIVTHQSYNACLPHSPREIFHVIEDEGPRRLLHAGSSAAAMRLARRNICISEWLRKQLRPPRALVIGNPVHPRFSPCTQAVRGGRFCFVGRLVSDKGCDLLLQALAECARRGRRYAADIYGDGPERGCLERLAAALGLVGQVAFHGSAEGEALHRAYLSSLALVVPSRWQEPLGIVALEAMACGRAVIGSAGGGLGELLSGTGLTFANGDAAALADCLEQIAEDTALRAELERRGLERAAQFSLGKVAARYCQIYNEVLGEAPHYTRKTTGAANGRRFGILVAHPGTQHSLETALGLEQAGLLHRYCTSIGFHPQGRLVRWLRAAANGQGPLIEQRLSKRFLAHLPASRVATYPLGELLYLSAAHLGITQSLTEPLLRWRNERFDARIARLLEQERPGAVLGYDSAALRTFEHARRLGISCLLEQTIGHLRTAAVLYREEAELHPDFADSLPPAPPAWLLERCTREALEADCVLAPSEYVRSTLGAIGVSEERITLLPYGADTERFTPAAARNDKIFRILFVGQLSQRKGIKYLLEAFRLLRLPDAELVFVGHLVGSGQGLRAYQEHIRYIPYVPQTELPQWYVQADLFVYPSLHEGSALAIYEALAAGLPVITTPNSGSVVRDGVEGFVVPIRDTAALAEKILLLYENPELRRAMACRARARAEEFTWAAYRKNLAALVRPFAERRL